MVGQTETPAGCMMDKIAPYARYLACAVVYGTGQIPDFKRAMGR